MDKHDQTEQETSQEQPTVSLEGEGAPQPQRAQDDAPVIGDPSEQADELLMGEPVVVPLEGPVAEEGQGLQLTEVREETKPAPAVDPEKRQALLQASWTSMNERFGWLWRKLTSRFFRDLSISEERVELLQETQEKGTIVYVLRSRSSLNYLIYNVLFLANGLSLSRYAQGLYWLPWQPVFQQLRVFFSWIGRLFGFGGKGADVLFRDLVRHGETTMIFLKQPVTLWTYFRQGLYWFQNRVRQVFGQEPSPGGRRGDLIEELVRIQRQQETPIFLCPQVLIWDPIAPSTRKTFWDVVFGEKEFPGILREFYLFLRHRSKSQVRGGEPINIKAFMAQQPKKLTDADIARKLRWQMLDSFANEMRVSTGPKLRPAKEMKSRVLGANRVKAAIKAEADEKGVDIEVVQKRALKIVTRLAADYSMMMTLRMDWLLGKFWSRMYQIRESDEPGLGGMEVDKKAMKRVREAAKEAPLLLLPSHKSHVDYLVLSQVCLHYGMVPPHIAAGDNLSIPVLGWIFRKSGAFFIRRAFGQDHVYRAIVVEYLHRLIREGYNIEFFIEGGRSRTGKLRAPRMGMLGMFVDGILEKRIRDFMLAPIAINYDRIVEGESYTRELLGEKKKKESLKGLLRSWDVLKVNFGRVYINPAKPISARAWIEAHIEEERRTNPDYDPVTSTEDRRKLTQKMAYLVVHDINTASVIMPTALVAALLLTNSRKGIRHEDLVSQVKWLREEIVARGGKVPEFENVDALVRRTVAFLSKMIKQPSGLLETVYRPSDSRRLELSYYRNQLGHLFLAEGVIVCSLYAYKQMRATDRGVKREELFRSTQFLSRLLKLEFVFNPGHDFDVNFQDTLDDMLSRGTLEVKGEYLKVAKGSERMFSFLQALYAPFIDSYWVTSLSFCKLLSENEPFEEKKLIEVMQRIADTLFHEGHLRYSDSISQEPLKNALALFEDLQVIERLKAEEVTQKWAIRRPVREKYVALRDSFQGSSDTLIKLLKRVGRYSSCYDSARVVERVCALLGDQEQGAAAEQLALPQSERGKEKDAG